MESSLLSDIVKRVTDGHYDLYASLYGTTETNGDTIMHLFELQLHDIEEPIKLKLKLGAASELLVEHASVWENYNDYLDQLEADQIVRWNNLVPAPAYVHTIQILNEQRAAKLEKEEGEREVQEAEEAKEILKEKLTAVEATFPLFNSRFPPEIRQQIWDYVMETPAILRPYRYKSDGGSLCGGYSDATESPKNINITQVCQQVRDEAAYRLYRNTTFSFPEPQTLECFLAKMSSKTLKTIRKLEISFSFPEPQTLECFLAKMSSKTLKTIRKLEISFDHADFFRVFKAWELVQDKYHLQWREFTSLVSNLQKLSLNKLTIRLPHHGLLWRYGWGNGCHFVVCKWIIKAVKDAMCCYSYVILHFKVDRLNETQRAELDAILSAKETASYEALSDGTLTLPPVCECAESCGRLPSE